MAAGNYDGSINIDTRIDESGFNQGIKKVGKSMDKTGSSLSKILDFKDIGSKLKSMGSTLKVVFAAVGAAIVTGIVVALTVVAVILAVIIAAIQAIIGMTIAASLAFYQYTNIMYKGLGTAQYMYDEFKNMHSLFADLKSSLLAAFSPLWIAVEPIVVRIITWLIAMINILQQALAIILGQSTYMKYVAGSAEKAAQATGGMKKNTKDTEKAAKGALAAFDEINVLQQDVPEQDIPGGGGGAPAIGSLGEFMEVPVDSKIKEFIDNIKNWFYEAWENIKLWASIAWEWISEKALWVWNNVLKPVWEWLSDTFAGVWDWISEKAVIAWEWVKETWGIISEWFQENIFDPLWEKWTGFWELIQILAWDAYLLITFAWMHLKEWFQQKVFLPLQAYFSRAWEKIKFTALLAWAAIQIIWKVAADWMREHVIDPLKTVFRVGLNWIKEKWETVFTGIGNFVKGVINKIIGFINTMLRALTNGLNTIISLVNSVGAFIPGWVNIPSVSAPQIPELAEGGVIPPNAAFMAILGDQRHGTNIEAPEELIRQIVREEAGMNQNVTINFAGSLGALVRELKPYIDKENSRIGSSLVQGSIT